jgi:hypothetical protein
MSASESATRPSPPPLPDLPPIDFWSETQWAVWFALVEAAIPSVSPESSLEDSHRQVRISDDELRRAFSETGTGASLDAFKALLADNPATSPAFIDNMKRSVASLPAHQLSRIGGFCSSLQGRIASLLLTGYCTPMHLLPVHTRERILNGWRGSRLTQLRAVAKTVRVLAQKSYFQTSPLFKELSGYSDVPAGYRAGRGFDFQFLQFDVGDEPAVIETDVVIVGSGIGGSVCAKLLAETGASVVLVDKSHYFPPSQLPMQQEAAGHYLMENGGFVGVDDGSAFMVAGSAWGGGGTVNWSVGLQTQSFVREEWDKQVGGGFFASEEYQEGLDWADAVMGITTDNVRHNHANRVILDGSRKLGWKAAVAPQNSGGAEHYCGRCIMGCGSNEKRGPTVSLLPAAAEAGAQFIEGFQVRHVCFQETSAGEGGAKVATGVVGVWTSRDAAGRVGGSEEGRTTRQVEIRAKKVVVACGALWSPVVLLNSGLTVCVHRHRETTENLAD